MKGSLGSTNAQNQRERNGVGKTNESGMVGCLCCGCAICVSSSHYEILANVESHHRYDRFFDSEVKRMASNQKLDDDTEFNKDRLNDPDVLGRGREVAPASHGKLASGGEVGLQYGASCPPSMCVGGGCGA